MVLPDLLFAAAERNPAQALAWADEAPPNTGPLTSAYARWAEHDPAGAATRTVQETDTAERSRAIAASAETWARRDLPGVLAWRRALADEKLKDQALAIFPP